MKINELRRLINKEIKHLNEAIGDAQDELVDTSNFEHLEVGNTYRWFAGTDSGVSEFKGWVDKSGAMTDSSDPKEVELLFADKDGFEWSAYLYNKTYVVGSDADKLYVEEI